jgi:O-Antigen ligase
MTISPHPRFIALFSALTVFSTFFVQPITQTLLITHVVMLAIVFTWVLLELPRSLVFASVTGILIVLYMLIIQQLVTLGDRVFNESIKYTILIFFTFAMMCFSNLNRKILLYSSFIIPVSLLLYVFISPDPFIYGGRLGIAIGGTDDDAMVSANTLGFIINICGATMISRRPKLFIYFLPLFLTLLYFTFSRGALLSLGIIALAYCLRERRMVYVYILSAFSIFVFVDTNLDVITTTLRLDDATGSGRTILYQLMVEEMVANPITLILGNGPGSVNFEIYTGKVIVSAHNGYLEMIYTFGAIGLISVLWFLRSLIRNYWSLPMDALLYAVLIASYALSEDLMGSHNIMPIGLMLGLVLHEFLQCAKRRDQTQLNAQNPNVRRAWG